MTMGKGPRQDSLGKHIRRRLQDTPSATTAAFTCTERSSYQPAGVQPVLKDVVGKHAVVAVGAFASLPANKEEQC